MGSVRVRRNVCRDNGRSITIHADVLHDQASESRGGVQGGGARSFESSLSPGGGAKERRGVGKIRHLHTPLLWLQQKTRSKEIKIVKARTEFNWSDLATKVHDRKRMDECLGSCGFSLEEGRSALALRSAGAAMA